MEVTRKVVQSRMEGIAFMARTGIYADEVSRGFGRAVMPLSGNENHVGSMYIGALSVLAEAGAAICGSTFIDYERYFPVVRNMQLEFLKPARSSVSAEYRLAENRIAELLSSLDANGRAEYTAELPMLDEAGVTVARASATITILQRRD
jgi:hypothetical protein